MARKFSSSIMSIADMIDAAFGDPEVNIVNMKLIQTVLYILARQLRILERRVSVDISGVQQSSSNLSVTEVKLHAMQKNKLKSGPGVDPKSGRKVKGGLREDAKGGTGGESPAASLSDSMSSDKMSLDKTAVDKTSLDKISNKIMISPVKTSYKPDLSDKIPAQDKLSQDKQESSTTKKGITRTGRSTKRGPTDYVSLEAMELQREAELRVIHQRADSHEENEKTPSPMASLDSVEATYEKLLVVERISSDEARARTARGRSGALEKAPRISVVTQEDFEKLAATVRQLQQKFGPDGNASLPENAHLMKEMRKDASLTDAMAALQLSGRLEDSEKKLEKMLAIVELLSKKVIGKGITGTENVPFRPGHGTARKSAILTKKDEFQKVQHSSTNETVIKSSPDHGYHFDGGAGGIEGEEWELPDRITYGELNDAMKNLRDEMTKMITDYTKQSTANADKTYKMAERLEARLSASLDLGTRMEDMETLVSDYCATINSMDIGLSSQMTNYQEELTQMQHHVEIALETMGEVLASPNSDPTAIAALNAHFSNLQSDVEDTMMRQKDLKNTLNALALDFEALRKQIEILRDIKADREEVADALRDKVGLGALNGLVSLQQFDAVRGDIEKKIATAYDKFNSQESIWQKIIDDLLRELNEKTDWIHVVSLREDINKHLDNFRCRLNTMMEIVGEPRAAAVAKKLHRDAACLCCSTPADMLLEEHKVLPVLPAMIQPTKGSDARKPKEDGDHGPCYPGHPIPHPRDPRTHVCKRWCGGSHTVISHTVSRAPVGMLIKQVGQKVTTAVGTDGKMYMVDQPMKPCAQCLRMTTPRSSIAAVQIQDQEDIGSVMTASYFRSPDLSMLDNETPPPPRDED